MVSRKVDPAGGAYGNPFPDEERFLFAETLAPEGNRPGAADDAVPGEVLLGAVGIEDADDLARGAGASGEGGDLAVRYDLAAGDTLQDRNYASGEGEGRRGRGFDHTGSILKASRGGSP